MVGVPPRNHWLTSTLRARPIRSSRRLADLRRLRHRGEQHRQPTGQPDHGGAEPGPEHPAKAQPPFQQQGDPVGAQQQHQEDVERAAERGQHGVPEVLAPGRPLQQADEQDGQPDRDRGRHRRTNGPRCPSRSPGAARRRPARRPRRPAGCSAGGSAPSPRPWPRPVMITLGSRTESSETPNTANHGMQDHVVQAVHDVDVLRSSDHTSVSERVATERV